MKKLLAGLLGLVLSVMTVLPAVAQNGQGRYDAVAGNGVNYTLNSYSAFYGQLFNSVATSTGVWSLGFGSSKSTVGTDVLSWDSAGHVLLAGIAAPVVSSCGTAPSVAAGSDSAGDVTMGTISPTTCTLTFAAAYTNVPHCFVSNRTSQYVAIAQATASTLVIVGTVSGGKMAAAADVLDYVCIGHN